MCSLRDLDCLTLGQDGLERPELEKTNFAENKPYQVAWFVRKVESKPPLFE